MMDIYDSADNPRLEVGKTKFTLEQIKAAHEKVKSGADFPNYIKEINGLGIISYKTYVEDGHSNFYGEYDYKVSWPLKYNPLKISDKSNAEGFIKKLREHQKGKTNFMTFCSDCAETGISNWEVSTKKMTCTYYDKKGNEVLIESIPTV